jgi:hypothetical protein
MAWGPELDSGQNRYAKKYLKMQEVQSSVKAGPNYAINLRRLHLKIN